MVEPMPVLGMKMVTIEVDRHFGPGYAYIL